MGYGAYPALKETGIPWLGPVPAHWRPKRLRFTLQTNPSANAIRLESDALVSFVPMDAVGEYGGIRADIDKDLGDIGSGYTYFADGDVVVAKITPCFENGKGAVAEGLTNGIAFGTTELHVLRAGRELDKRFLFYLTISHPFRALGEAEMYGAGGQKRVPDSFIKDFRPALPPLAEQQAIARFLDHKTAQIDVLIAKKEALLQKLAEKRTALISHAVTKGLDPSAPMTSSGVPWLGDIPAHWITKPLKYLAQVGNGSTPSRDSAAYWDDGYYPWLNSSVVNLEMVTEAADYVTDIALQECHLPKIQPPAILVGITGQGRTRGMASTLGMEATINQHLAFIKPRSDEMTVGYLRRIFDRAYSFLRSESDGGGSTKGAITCEQIANLKVPVPPSEEQARIAKFADQETYEASEMTLKIETAIDRLKEYRSALITAAVTGKIDVRHVPVPEAARP